MPPHFSVVIPTHDRAASLMLALGDVLAQQFTDFEVIVVIDGSSDTTAAELEGVDDPRLRVVKQSNEGPCRARNAGAELARGRWLVFLDDDDRVAPNWLAILSEHTEAADVGVVCCGTILVDEHGTVLDQTRPRRLGPLYNEAQAQFAAGAFAVSRALFERSGGYDSAMSFGENFELGLRLVALCEAQALRIEADGRTPLRWTRRPEAPITNERCQALHGAGLHMLAKHATRLAGDPAARWRLLSITGVNALRLGRIGDGRRLFAQAVRVCPTRLTGWARLVTTVSPWLARRVWGDHRDATGDRMHAPDDGPVLEGSD